ncbi:MAG: glucose-6-phosphate isomerase [Alphaproteobacteria bacterium]
MNAGGMVGVPYRHDHAGALGPHGLDAAGFARHAKAAWQAVARLRELMARAAPPPLALAQRSDDVDALAGLAAELRESADDVVVLGIGGASLGAQTLCALAGGQGPRLTFVENIDPLTWDRLLARLELDRTVVLAVSRSGATPETVAQALLAAQALGRARARDRLVVLTGPGATPLRAIAENVGARTLDHDPDLSGRYSVLANVGLLPALIAGLDARAVRAGAAAALDAALGAEAAEACPPAVGAALNIGLARDKGIGTAVMMVYADALQPFSAWFVQLWGESLGKGGQGTVPVRALGATDQHSQLQLYLDGPRDKFVTLVVLDRAGTGPTIDIGPAGSSGVEYLGGRTLGDLMAAEQRATAEVLIGAGRPVRVIRLPRLDERSLGALLMHTMLETILAADLLGVNAFDQPAVELGKVLTKRYLAAG